MNRNELLNRIDALRTVIGVNRTMLTLVPKGADRAGEASVEADLDELYRLEADLERLDEKGAA
jgi:hypothetical protein